VLDAAVARRLTVCAAKDYYAFNNLTAPSLDPVIRSAIYPMTPSSPFQKQIAAGCASAANVPRICSLFAESADV
jgi:hypothetical protein